MGQAETKGSAIAKQYELDGKEGRDAAKEIDEAIGKWKRFGFFGIAFGIVMFCYGLWQRKCYKVLEHQKKQRQIPTNKEVILSSKTGNLSYTGVKGPDMTFEIIKIAQGKGYAVKGVKSHEFLSGNRIQGLAYKPTLGKEGLWNITPIINGKYIFKNGDLSEELEIQEQNPTLPTHKKVIISSHDAIIGMDDNHNVSMNASKGPEKDFEILPIKEGPVKGYALRSISTGCFLTAHDPKRGLIAEPHLRDCEIWQIAPKEGKWTLWNPCFKKFLGASSKGTED